VLRSSGYALPSLRSLRAIRSRCVSTQGTHGEQLRRCWPRHAPCRSQRIGRATRSVSKRANSWATRRDPATTASPGTNSSVRCARRSRRSYPPEASWFVQDDDDTDFLVSEAEGVFDRAQKPEAHASAFLKRCSARIIGRSVYASGPCRARYAAPTICDDAALSRRTGSNRLHAIEASSALYLPKEGS